MKNMPAGQEDAEEEQKAPKAGDILNEQDAFLLKKQPEHHRGAGQAPDRRAPPERASPAGKRPPQAAGGRHGGRSQAGT